MSGFNGGRGRGRAVRNDAGRGEPQPTPQYDPAHQNYESNSFTGMFGGFLDPTQPFGNYHGSMNEQPPVQQPFVGAGMQPPFVGAGMQPPLVGAGGMQQPIQPNIPYMGGASSTPLLYQQFGTISPHFNGNQFMGQPRMPSHSVHNEGVQHEGVGRDRHSPAPESDTSSTNTKIYLQPDGDT